MKTVTKIVNFDEIEKEKRSLQRVIPLGYGVLW
jgi:hypothetical protein